MSHKLGLFHIDTNAREEVALVFGEVQHIIHAKTFILMNFYKLLTRHSHEGMKSSAEQMEITSTREDPRALFQCLF